jgi:hypothetical protein
MFAMPIVLIVHYFIVPFWWHRQRSINRIALKNYMRYIPPNFDRENPPKRDDPKNPWLRVVSRNDPIMQTYEDCDVLQPEPGSFGTLDEEWVLLKADLAIFMRLKKKWWLHLVAVPWAPYIAFQVRAATQNFVEALERRRRALDNDLFDSLELKTQRVTAPERKNENYNLLADMLNGDGDEFCLPECSLCFELLDNSSHTLNGCQCSFHEMCIIKWIRTTKAAKCCPACDTGIDPEDEQMIDGVKKLM